MPVALLLHLVVVTFLIGRLVAGPEGLWPLGGLCFLPVALVLGVIAVFKPSTTLVFENGIEISLPLWRQIRGERRYYAWSEIRDVYPRSYEVAGSFLSPFASSAGTLVHTGIGLETQEGRRLLIRFTPGSIRGFRSDSRGYLESMAVIRDRFARRAEPMVRTARTFSDAQVLELQAQAHAPLIPMSRVFLAFLLPPAILAAILVALFVARVTLTTPIVAAAFVVALIPLAQSMIRTLRRSEQRNLLLSELAKYQEHVREGASAGSADWGKSGPAVSRCPDTDGGSRGASVPQPRPQSGEPVDPVLQRVGEGRQQGDDPRRVDEFVPLPVRIGPEGHDPRDAQPGEMISDRSPGPLETAGHFAVGHRSFHREAQDDGEGRGPSTFGQQPTIGLVQPAGLLRKD